MTRSDPRQNTAALSAALSGAVDLSAVKARAEAASRKAAAPPGEQAEGGASASGWIIDVTEATFQAEVVERSLQVPVVVDLWADWCGPCKQLSPVLERLADAGGGSFVLAKVDVDANPRIAQLFGVQSIPTVVAIAGGQPVDAFAGALPEPQIREWLTAVFETVRERLPGVRTEPQEGGEPVEAEPAEPPEDPRFVAAEEAIERGDYAEAEAAYQRILDSEPANDEARTAIAQVHFLARVDSAEPDSVARADAAPDDVAAQLTAADVEVAEQRAPEAFKRLIGAIRRSAGDDRDALRKHLVELFELFAPDDPQVAKARRDLASALF